MEANNFLTGILITDDDTTSDSITLEVSPAEISESDGATEVTVTGTLNGKVFRDNVYVPLTFSNDLDGDGTVDVEDDAAATRDIDYQSIPGTLVIPGGQVAGTVKFTITPTADDKKEGDEKIGVASASNPKARDEDDVEEELEVAGATITLKDVVDGTPPTTPTDPTTPTLPGAVAAQEYTVGTAIAPLVLPAASGGTAPLTYSVSTLPAGLSFDTANADAFGHAYSSDRRRSQYHLHGARRRYESHRVGCLHHHGRRESDATPAGG